jgi:hypothetical protein
MTVSISYPVHRTGWPHRAAVRLGRALVDWGAAPALEVHPLSYRERVRSLERSRDAAARVLPQLPR